MMITMTGSAESAGALVFASVVSPTDLDAGVTVADETRSCIRALAQQLEAVGSSLSGLIRASCVLSADEYRAEFWATWSEEFAGVDAVLVRLTQVASIGGDRRVLIDAVAVRNVGDVRGVTR